MNPFDQAPLALYALALTLTPGPSALLVAASGAGFGLARCAPHLAGSLLGYELQLLAAVLGTEAPVLRDPLLQMALKLASSVHLLRLGWRLLGSRHDEGGSPSAPLPWQTAAALQLANPKSWLTAMAVALAVTAPGGLCEALAP